MRTIPDGRTSICALALLLVACGGGGDGGNGGTPVTPPQAPTLTLGVAPKQLRFTWNTVDGANLYRLRVNPDGASGFTPVADIPSPQTRFDLDVAVHLHDWPNARYLLDACNNAGCTGSNEVTAAASVLQAIGYFKASNTDAGDQFGIDVAVSGDGHTLAVGAFNEDGGATGVGGNQGSNSAPNAGAVYVFRRASDGTWSQDAYLKASNTGAGDGFGTRVALNETGDTLAVSASAESSAATGIGGDQANNNAPGSGAVYVFRRAAGGWSQEAYVKASNTDAGDSFGSDVALTGDGNTLAVGAINEASTSIGLDGFQGDDGAPGAGAVYVFRRNNTLWSPLAYVKASNTDPGDNFGSAVALSADGGTLAVGATGEDSSAIGIGGNQIDDSAADAGAVYVFRNNLGALTQQSYLKASNTDAGDSFGSGAALSGDGNALAVGAIGEASASGGVNGNQSEDSSPGAGAAYVFRRDGSGAWSQQAYIKSANPDAADNFGIDVASNSAADLLAVGAPGEDGSATALNGDQADDNALDAGAVFVFLAAGNTWTQRTYLKATNTDAGDLFGGSLALSTDGNTLASGASAEDSAASGVSADQADDSATDAGAAYLY